MENLSVNQQFFVCLKRIWTNVFWLIFCAMGFIGAVMDNDKEPSLMVKLGHCVIGAGLLSLMMTAVWVVVIQITAAAQPKKRSRKHVVNYDEDDDEDDQKPKLKNENEYIDSFKNPQDLPRARLVNPKPKNVPID